MRFLYDSSRRLFGVGYAVGGPVEFSSHYDLLASECRLASLVAIAKGDVPVEHWYALGRPRISLPGGAVLLSWSGTMFEYLMPLLFMRTFANSLLDHACREAVRQQIVYGHEKRRSLGHFRMRLRRAGCESDLSVPRLRSSLPGAQTRPRRTTWWWRRTRPCWRC